MMNPTMKLVILMVPNPMAIWNIVAALSPQSLLSRS
jgi:hypothetical protein